MRFDVEELRALETLQELTGADISSIVREAVIEHARRSVEEGKPRDLASKRQSATLHEAFAKYSAMCAGEERAAS